MPRHDIILIGAGAGGIEATETVLRGFPADLDASVFIVQHIPGHTPGVLAAKMNETCALPVTHPAHGEKIEQRHVYLAPPNRHLMVADGAIILGNGPKENRVRPAIDALFRSAAHAYGARVVGVILSGVLNDGTAGLMSVKRHGGVCIVQDPDEANFDGMPRSAMTFTVVDNVLPVGEIAPVLVALVGHSNEQDRGEIPMSAARDYEDSAQFGGPGLSHLALVEPPSALTCPACGGAVWQVQNDALTLFKCHVGHSYTAELILEEQSEAVDAAAWVLLRSIEENIYLRRKLASWARLTDRVEEAEFHEEQARNAEKQSTALKALVLESDRGRD